MGKWKKPQGRERRWNRRQLIARDGNVCGICGKTIETAKDITLDHIDPLSNGGLDVLENLQLAHRVCNQIKGSTLPEHY